MLYEITAADDEWIQNQARERQRNKEERNIASQRFDPNKSDYEIHLEGMRAEFAVAQLLNGTLNWKLLIGGDRNIGDLLLPDGRSVSVKFRKRKGWHFALQSDNPKDFREDIGVLVYPSNSHLLGLNICRWTSRENFLALCHTTDYGYGPRLVIEPSLMLPIESLLENVGGM